MSLTATLDTGVSTLDAFSTGLQVISNNIANSNTVGFKSSDANYGDSFSDVLKQATPAPASGDGSNSDPLQIGTGVSIASVTSNFSQGTLTSTGKNTDLGISGGGFYVVRDPSSGVEYATRAGNFSVDSQGYLVTSNGYRVQGLSDGGATYSATDNNGTLTYTQTATAPSTVGDIKVNFNLTVGNGLTNDTGGAFTDAQVQAGAPSVSSFTVDPQGNVVMNLSNGDTFDRGQILLQNYSDPNALTNTGNNLYSGLAAAGPIGGSTLTAANNAPGSNGNGQIEVGSLEQSNVDLSQEMTNMIIAQRSFQAGSRIITVADTLLEETVNLKRQ